MTEDVAAVLAGSKPWAVEQGDALSVLQQMPAESVHCCVTSPPYFNLRAYGDGNAAELGREQVPDCLGWTTGQKCGSCYVCRMVAVGEAVKRVLRDDGTFWLNIGDGYNAFNGNRGPSTSISANREDAMPRLPSGNGLSAKGRRFRLRKDLTEEQMAYVLSELSKARRTESATQEGRE